MLPEKQPTTPDGAGGTTVTPDGATHSNGTVAAPNGAGGTPAAGGTSTPSTTAQPAAGRGARPAEEWRNADEIKAYMKRTQRLEDELRELRAGRTAAPTPPTAPAGGAPSAVESRVAATEARIAELDLVDAMDELDAQPTKEQKAVLKRRFRADRPGDVRAWLADMMFLGGAATKPQPAPVPEVTPPVPPAPAQRTGQVTDTGPAGGGLGPLPNDPNLIPPHVWKGLESSKRMEIVAAWKQSLGVGQKLLVRNPRRAT